MRNRILWIVVLAIAVTSAPRPVASQSAAFRGQVVMIFCAPQSY
jgi:hypothetical protein